MQVQVKMKMEVHAQVLVQERAGGERAVEFTLLLALLPYQLSPNIKLSTLYFEQLQSPEIVPLSLLHLNIVLPPFTTSTVVGAHSLLLENWTEVGK